MQAARAVVARSTLVRSSVSLRTRAWSKASGTAPSTTSAMGQRAATPVSGPVTRSTTRGDDRAVGDAHGVLGRAPVGIAVGGELLELAGRVEAGLLMQRPQRGLVKGFVRTLEAPGERPGVSVLIGNSLDKDHMESLADHREHDHVHRDSEARRARGFVVAAPRTLGGWLSLHGPRA